MVRVIGKKKQKNTYNIYTAGIGTLMGQILASTPKPQTTVIIPTFNEADNIASTIAAIRGNRCGPVEIIVADGYSTDKTTQLARRAGARTLRVRGGRAAQLNAGASRAQASHLLFLHADTAVSPAFDMEIARILDKPGVSGGAFRLTIASSRIAIRVIERVANWRASFLQRPYGDQGLFFRREAFTNIGGFPQMPLLDDYEIVRRVSKSGRIEISKLPVTTSARRWDTLGVVKTTLLNQIIIAGYHCGVPVHRLHNWYRGALLRAKRRPKHRGICSSPHCA